MQNQAKELGMQLFSNFSKINNQRHTGRLPTKTQMNGENIYI